MKHLNLNTKEPCFFIKGITVLSLSFVLQGRSCVSGRGIQDQVLKTTTHKEFCDEIENKKDISIPDVKTGNNWLYTSVMYNEPKKVEHILKRIDQDINQEVQYRNKDFYNEYQTKSGKTPLGLAIEKGYTEIVKQLIEKRYIDINKAKKGSTSLLEALSNKQEKIAEVLLNQPKIDISTIDTKSGSLPLHWAIEQKYKTIALLLIDKKYADKDLKRKNNKGETPLHLLIKHSLDNLAISLVQKLSNLDDLCGQDKKGRTPLHMVVRANQKSTFQALFNTIRDLCKEKNEFVNKLFQKDKEGRSVFARACLPEYATQGWVHIPKENLEMFEYVLTISKDSLERGHFDLINNEINSLKKKGKIKEKYAGELIKIVNRYSLVKNAPGA